MSTNLPEPQPSEEIDLGQLFKLIGNMFDRFFRFIGSIFKGLFFLFMDLLVFIQGHIKKLALVGILGVVTGTYFDMKTPPLYESNMIVEPNFESTKQLYHNIYSYGELARARDSFSLATALKITLQEAATIKNVSIEISASGNQKVLLYDEFIKELDTSTMKDLDFKKYTADFDMFNSRFHRIIILAWNNTVAKKAQRALVASVDTIPYYVLKKEINDINLQLRDSSYIKQIIEIDSLQKTLREVMLTMAKRPNDAGTNINLAEATQSDNKELALIQEVAIINNNQVLLNVDRGKTTNIINVISDFPIKGVKVRGFFKSNKFLFISLFVGMLLVALMLLELNKYLKKYKLEKLKK